LRSGTGSFPRRARLTAQAEFRQVFQEAIRSSDGSLTVLARPNDLGYPRLGLAISRRYAKGAVARNRIKRVARESFRLNQDRLGGLDIVVLAREGVDRKTLASLRAALESHWTSLIHRCRSS
jgi:ribonuclease P protein component